MVTKGEWKVKKFLGIYHIASETDEPIDSHIAIVLGRREEEANANLIAAAPDMYEALEEADREICELCKRLNPQHATADNGKGCNYCQGRETRYQALKRGKR